MQRVFVIFLISALFLNLRTFANEKSEILLLQEKEKESKKRVPTVYYGYLERSHTFMESFRNVGMAFMISTILYPLTQYKTVKNEGSFAKYKRNFGSVQFDNDTPFWNSLIHPLSGSQLFLYYRANSYSRTNALALAAISSALFEFTIEIYTEPASVQDLYQTPVLGAIFGLGLETLSLYLLNTGNVIGRILGHAINPSTLFWFYEGKVHLTPQINPNGISMIQLNIEI